MGTIRATDSIHLPESPEVVFRALADFGGYREWWPRTVRFRVIRLTAEVLGSRFAVRPLGGRGFECEVESADPPRGMKLAYTGIYRGSGCWSLEPSGTGTTVSYRVDLEITDRLTALIARLIDVPALHSRLMTAVLSGLRRHVAGRAPVRADHGNER